MKPADHDPQWTPAAGDWVGVTGMGGVAQILEVDARRRRARVELMRQQWVVPLARLTPADPPEIPRNDSSRLVHVQGGGAVYHQVDLHGMYVEDALAEAERGLDQAVVYRLDTFKIVHGHGSGRVRQAIRKMLDTHPHVEAYRFGDPQEGGLACTVVRLKQRH